MLSEKEQPVGEITVRPMEKHEWRAVVDVLARALRDNPTSVGMFGPDEDRRLRSLRALYGALLDDAPLPPLVACSDRRILGAAAVFPPGPCHPCRITVVAVGPSAGIAPGRTRGARPRRCDGAGGRGA